MVWLKKNKGVRDWERGEEREREEERGSREERERGEEREWERRSVNNIYLMSP